MTVTYFHWIVFNVGIAILLGIDLWRAYRKPHPISVKESLRASCGWILLSLLFCGWIYVAFDGQSAFAFLTGYLIEKSLSVDNLFIFLLIFTQLQVPRNAQHLVLFHGVLGAIVLRALLIWGGIELVEHFTWIFYFFGAFLVITGIRLSFKRKAQQEWDKSYVYQWLTKRVPFTSYHGTAFFVRQGGKWFATPLFAAAILIEMADVVFALDSVPAIFSVTTDPFIVYTSNILAILGLRSLFFALEGLIESFYLLHYALTFILVYIGLKMIMANFIYIPTWVTFVVLILSLTAAILGSLLYPAKQEGEN